MNDHLNVKIYYILTFDVYLLHVSVFVRHREREQPCQFLEKPTTVMILLFVVSILYLIYHVKCTFSNTFMLITLKLQN